MIVRARLVKVALSLCCVAGCSRAEEGSESSSSSESSTGGDAPADDTSGWTESTGSDDGPGEPFAPTPIGDPATATIGAAGGSLVSTDGRFALEVPAGALSTDTEIEIQQVEWEDGMAWELRPHGLSFATPVNATLTMSEREAGPFTTEIVDNVETVAVPLVHPFHVGEDGLSEVEATVGWRPEDGELDWSMQLSHFSWIGVVARGGELLGASSSAAALVGDSVWVVAQSDVPPFRTAKTIVTCPEARTVELPVRLLLQSLEVTLDEGGAAEKVGGVEFYGDPAATYGYRQQLRCKEVGNSSGALTWTTGTEVMEGTDVAPCELAPPSRVLQSMNVRCLERCTGSDPIDVGGLPEGDPALDLVCVKTGDSGENQAWVRVSFDGPWRPSASHYSWYSSVSFKFVGGGTGTFTTEHHLPSMPADSQFTDGALTLDQVTYTEEENGYLLVIDPIDPESIVEIAVESGLMKVPPPEGVFVPDAIATTPFDASRFYP